MAIDPRKTSATTQVEMAEAIAIQALSYLSGEPELMSRFLAITGIEAAHIREAAREPHFFAGVLQFFLAHEPTLLAFSGASGIEPSDIAAAYRALPGGAELVA